MESLIRNYQLLRKDYSGIYERNIFSWLESEFKIVGIVGNRGVGKTTYLFYYLNKYYPDSDRALYVSLDNIYFSQNTLVGLVERFVDEYDGELLCLDEIHRYPNWAQELKNIYDLYRQKIKIIFTGSSVIDLVKQKYDLSRRAVIKTMPGFSFREYLEFQKNLNLPVFSLEEIVAKRTKIPKKITAIPRLRGLFKEYLQVGYYPIFSEFKKKENVLAALVGVIDKMINIDIATHFSLKTETLPIFKKILYFIFTSRPGSINVSRLARSLGKSFPDTMRYIEMVRESGLVRYLLNDKYGHALIRNAEKVYLNDSNLMYALGYATGKEVNLGSVREVFALNQLQLAGYNVFAGKEGDFVVEDKKGKKYVLEIGGRNKTAGGIKGLKNAYLALDDVLFGDKYSFPLYLLGFLY